MTEEQFWMRKAIELARHAEAQGEVPIGAVLVVAGQSVAETWNSPILTNDATAHAEILALRLASERLQNYRLPDEATLYVTLEPCVMCAGALLHARLGRLVYGTSDLRVGAAGGAFHILSSKRFNHRVEIVSGVLQEECLALLTVFFQRRREQQTNAKRQLGGGSARAIANYHQLPQILHQLTQVLLANQQMVVTAESCTSGGLAAMLTCLPGSSRWFERGYITYSADAKRECLDVSDETLREFGAVSLPTALEMASGALAHSHAQLSVAMTGIAGPNGGTARQPVGTVCFAWCHCSGRQRKLVVRLNGTRDYIRKQACILALQGCLDLLADEFE